VGVGVVLLLLFVLDSSKFANIAREVGQFLGGARFTAQNRTNGAAKLSARHAPRPYAARAWLFPLEWPGIVRPSEIRRF
jgi:hypothetical protein